MENKFSVWDAIVVFIVLSILAGLLLPALARSHENRPRDDCASNLRQLGLAAATYSGDHREELPTVLPEGSTKAKQGDGQRFRRLGCHLKQKRIDRL